MQISNKLARTFLAVLAATAMACEDVTEAEPEPDVSTLRLVIGTTNQQTITVTNTGVVTGGPIALRVNTPLQVTATFLNDAGQPDPVAMSDEFRLDVTAVSPASITYTPATDFTGSIAGSSTTTGSARFSLYHKSEGHPDWGPWTIQIQVAP